MHNLPITLDLLIQYGPKMRKPLFILGKTFISLTILFKVIFTTVYSENIVKLIQNNFSVAFI